MLQAASSLQASHRQLLLIVEAEAAHLPIKLCLEPVLDSGVAH